MSRDVIRRLTHALGVRFRALRHELGIRWRATRPPTAGRDRALSEEVAYWREYLQTRGMQWPDEFEFRFDPDAEVGELALREVLGGLQAREVSILDVGAGPASIVGHRFAGKVLRLTPVDPLADEYATLLAEEGLAAPVPTQPGDGEHLVERFGAERFDVVFSRNALDHLVDPVAVIRNMLTVVRPGCSVVLRHARNEAVTEDYRQLHQWKLRRT